MSRTEISFSAVLLISSRLSPEVALGLLNKSKGGITYFGIGLSIALLNSSLYPSFSLSDIFLAFSGCSSFFSPTSSIGSSIISSILPNASSIPFEKGSSAGSSFIGFSLGFDDFLAVVLVTVFFVLFFVSFANELAASRALGSSS